MWHSSGLKEWCLAAVLSDFKRFLSKYFFGKDRPQSEGSRLTDPGINKSPPERSSKTLAAGRPHCRTRASCWKRLERENVHASVDLADVWTVLERGLLLLLEAGSPPEERARDDESHDAATREGRMAVGLGAGLA